VNVKYGSRRSAKMSNGMHGYARQPPVECVFCLNSTSGRFTIRGEFVCGKCWDKYEVIPVHIPLNQILRYYRALRKKRLDKDLLNLTLSDKNSIM
jgi:hypothetical protein